MRTNLFTLTKNKRNTRSHGHADASAPRMPRDPITIPSAMNDRRRRPHGGGGRDRTDDPLLAKQVLSQLSYAPNRHDGMGQGGLEPPTPRLSSVCSNQLSY